MDIVLSTTEESGRMVQFGHRRTSAEPQEAVVQALNAAGTAGEAIASALDLVRERFGWAYASYWRVDPADRALHFVQESGSAGEEFRQVTLAASFREGVGLAGRAWKVRDLVFVETLAPSAERLETLRAIGRLVSQTIERIVDGERQAEAAQDMAAVNRVLREIARATTRESAMAAALASIREGFGWAYGSYWAVDEEQRALTFVQ